MEPWRRAVEAIERRAKASRELAIERLARHLGQAGQLDQAARATRASVAPPAVDELVAKLRRAGRVTLNFHPDRISAAGVTVAAGLAAEGRYRSQWVTGISNGGRSALPGGLRHRWERELFAGSYEGCDPRVEELPVYGAFDLLHDPHGGAPRFGSCHVVLSDAVVDRTTFCVGDSHLQPSDVGAGQELLSILAGLVEQAARGELLGRRLGLEALGPVLDGRRPLYGPGRELDRYVEAQVHGGVSLASDVVAIAADPSFRGTGVERSLARAADRYGLELRWHNGSRLRVADTPADFRGPGMPALARRVAVGGIVDASAIGRAASALALPAPGPAGDPDDTDIQQLKFLWHTVLAFGTDATVVDATGIESGTGERGAGSDHLVQARHDLRRRS